jgi:hypothetical protein
MNRESPRVFFEAFNARAGGFSVMQYVEWLVTVGEDARAVRAFVEAVLAVDHDHEGIAGELLGGVRALGTRTALLLPRVEVVTAAVAGISVVHRRVTLPRVITDYSQTLHQVETFVREKDG